MVYLFSIWLKFVAKQIGTPSGTKSALHLFSLKSNLKIWSCKGGGMRTSSLVFEFHQVYTPTSLEAWDTCRHWNFVGLYKMHLIQVELYKLCSTQTKILGGYSTLNPSLCLYKGVLNSLKRHLGNFIKRSRSRILHKLMNYSYREVKSKSF